MLHMGLEDPATSNDDVNNKIRVIASPSRLKKFVLAPAGSKCHFLEDELPCPLPAHQLAKHKNKKVSE
jgi:hypothetical protein